MKNSEKTWTDVLVIFVVGIGIILFSFSHSSSQSPVIASTTPTSDLEQSRNCGTEARTFSSQILATDQATLSWQEEEKETYKNHFNIKDDKCYMLVTSGWFNNNIGNQNIRLYDVYDHDLIDSSLTVFDVSSTTAYCSGKSIGSLAGDEACQKFKESISEKMEE